MANPNPEVQNTNEAPKEVANKFDFGSVFPEKDKQLVTHDSTRTESRYILSGYPFTEPSELDLQQSNERKNGEDIQLLGRLNDAWKSESKATNPNKVQMERIANAAEALQDFALKDSDKYWKDKLAPQFQAALDGKLSKQDFEDKFHDYYGEMNALASSLSNIDPERTKELSYNASNLFHVTRSNRLFDIDRAKTDRLRVQAESGKTEDILALVEAQTFLGHEASIKASPPWDNQSDKSLIPKYSAEEVAMDTDNLRRFEQLEEQCKSPAELLKLSSAYMDMTNKLNIRANHSKGDQHDDYFKTAVVLTEKNNDVHSRLITMAKNGELNDDQMIDLKLLSEATAGRLINYDTDRYSAEERQTRDRLRAGAESRAAYADMILRDKIGDEKYNDLFVPKPLTDEEYEQLANPK